MQSSKDLLIRAATEVEGISLHDVSQCGELYSVCQADRPGSITFCIAIVLIIHQPYAYQNPALHLLYGIQCYSGCHVIYSFP